MNKLIKLKDDHYVVVDDSEIKEGDWYHHPNNNINQYGQREIEFMGNDEKNACKKITHSTQPLGVKPITDKVVIQEDKAGKPLMSAQYVELDMSCTVKPLSLQEVKELIGEVDVEKKAEKYTSHDMFWYKQGYNQALEDNKEKKYTEDDMIKCWKYASMDKHQIFGDQIGEYYLSFIKSLQPKTEWEVEIVDDKLKLK